MFQRRLHHNELVGFEATIDSSMFFFGTRHCPRALLPQLYPRFQFGFLKQVHGNRVVTAASAATPEADGHVTDEKNLALVIQTADCLPILMSGKTRVMALHAGWRGLAAGIIDAAAPLGHFEFATIGPHIRAGSYEVGVDVAHQLSAVGSVDAVYPHPDPQKRRIDLAKIAEFQLHRSHAQLRVEILPDDTFISPLFHSFRRGKEKSERQYSFVAMIGNGISR